MRIYLGSWIAGCYDSDLGCTLYVDNVDTDDGCIVL